MRVATRLLALAALAIAAVSPNAAFAKKAKAMADGGKACNALSAADVDHDGKLELGEAKAAAERAFDRLNTDKDATLDRKELKGRLAKKLIKSSDPDKDGSLDKAEYVAIVEKLFMAANTDKDGSLDCKEAKSKAGRAMLRLLK